CLRVGEEIAQAAGLPSICATVQCDPGDLPAQGEQLLARLAALAGGGVTAADPGGLAGRVRGAGACGGAAADGLHLNAAGRAEVIARCRAIADRRFEDLMHHPDAAGCFKGGRGAVANAQGFRKARPEQQREWLREQIEAQADRLGLPLLVPATTAG